MKYGIWYDDGRFDMGWLHEEGRHGRTYPFFTEDPEEAKAKLLVEAARDKKYVFSVEPVDGDGRERFKRVHRLALQKRLTEAESLVEFLRRALAEP